MNGQLIFFGMIFATVFLLAQGLVVPVFGDAAKTRKRLRQRLRDIELASGQDQVATLLRANYLRQLSPTARRLEQLPGMEVLARIIEQAGHTYMAHRVVLAAIVLSVVAGFFVWTFTLQPVWALGAAGIAAMLPFLKILRDRKQRFALFEEQLPDAIDMMKRALRAGHPFSATLRLVAEDMSNPIAREFELTFADINYGNDLRRAMLGLLSRVPSVTVMALVTSVLVQKETGGNLAEILEQIGKVVRGRFRFHRKLRTLSAEGRLSAWILALVPLVLFAVIWVTSPDYLPTLLEHPVGQKLILFGFVSGIVGIIWIRKIIRIEV